jgi:hypothetical protein
MKKIDEEALMANVLVKLGIDFPTVIFRPKYSEKLQRLVIFVNIGNKKIRIYRAGDCFAVGAEAYDKLQAKPCATYWDMQVYLFRIFRDWGIV